MKLLTLNFLCCARKTCKTNPAAFPLHPKDAELEQVEAEINPLLIQNMLPRINWEALKTISQEVRYFLQTSILFFSPSLANLLTPMNKQLGLPNLPEQAPEPEVLITEDNEPTQTLKDLHTLLMETSVQSGKLVCGSCEHEYAVKEGIANFLLPSHMV
jgi:multifunctional methyltransferase subunit TRM112